MLNKFWTVCLVLLLALTAGLSAQSAEDWYLDKTIVDIRFTGLDAVSVNELKGIVRPYLSKKFTDSLSWEIQGKLYALEYFDLILPQVLPGEKVLPGESEITTVIVEFQVKEKPVVNQIVYTGNNRIRKGELNDTILLTKGDLLNKSSIRMDAQAIKTLYTEKGYVDADVNSSIEKNEEENTATVVFDIVEGTQTKIEEIRFVGNDVHVTDKTLKGLMQTKAQGLFKKGVLMENELQMDVQTIESYYHDRGFIDAEVREIKREVHRDEEDNTNKLIITLIIYEGEAYTFGGIELIGNYLFSTDELMLLISQEPGKVFNKTRFQFDYQSVTDLYYENGYIYNTFSQEENKDEENKVVSYVVNIVERDRAHLENVVIRGNDKTKDHVITRELDFEVGDVFSKKKVMDGVRNLNNTQYFSVVEPQTYPGSEDGLMDLVLDLEEGKTANIVFGVSFSGGTDFPVSGNIQWNDTNFLGTGRTLGISTLFSPDSQSLSLSFSEPRLFGTRWGAGVDLTYKHSDNSSTYQDIDGDGVIDPYTDEEDYENANEVVSSDYLMEYESHYVSVGGNTGYTWYTDIGRFATYTGLRGGWEYIDYDADIYRPWNDSIRENYQTWQYYDSWWIKESWDTRDNVGSPSKGFILSETLTVAGLLPTSTKDYMKSVTRGEINFKLWDIPVTDTWNFKTVFTVKSAFSYLFEKPWDSVDVDPDTDGFSVDGMFVARGWYPESDGQALWDNTATLKFPVAPGILAFDVFLDCVGLWSSKEALRDSTIADYRFSLGAGFRFDNPTFPIGLYLVKKFQFEDDGSVNWNPEPDYVEFSNGNLDLVISFGIDIY